jgi:catechol 2,3-dioxygenase-like lactoylglutathione lyase family enzyme
MTSTTPTDRETTPDELAATREQLQEIRELRRAKTPILRLHHNAIRTNDMEATREFYEDILGLPMVHTMKMAGDPTTGKPTPYLHCFFEMADGGMIAFFLTPHRDTAPLTPQDAFDHHLAIKVASFDDLLEIKKRFEERKYPTCGINHGFCFSLYVRDPNRMLVEIVADPEQELEMNERYAARAKRDWLSWKNGDFSSNEDDYSNVSYPLETSSIEEMNRVLPAERP